MRSLSCEIRQHWEHKHALFGVVLEDEGAAGHARMLFLLLCQVVGVDEVTVNFSPHNHLLLHNVIGRGFDEESKNGRTYPSCAGAFGMWREWLEKKTARTGARRAACKREKESRCNSLRRISR